MLREAMVKMYSSRQLTVGLLWTIPCIIMAISSKRIGRIEIVNFIGENLHCILAWTFYATVAAASCSLCMLSRVLLFTIQGREAGTLMAVLFHTGLASAIAIHLGSIDVIDLDNLNTPLEEIILSSTCGYYFYEMFYLHTRKSLEASLKILSMISATSIIVSALGCAHGANALLALIFLFSSCVPAQKLPNFGSSKYKYSVAYKAAIWSAYGFSVLQRILQAPSVFVRIWSSPSFCFLRWENAFYVSLYCLATGSCFFLAEIFKAKEHGENKSTIVPTRTKIVNNSLVPLKRRVAEAYE